MMKSWRVVLLIPCLVILVGCAGVRIGPEKFNKENQVIDRGIRYYESRPFLLVYTDSKGGLNSKLMWLPDTRHVRTIRPYAVAAKNNATFKFSGGVLTQSKTEIDQTAIPTAVISALKSAALASATAAMNAVQERDTGTLPAPILYAITQDSNNWKLVASDADPDHIDVTLVKQPKAESK